MQQHCVLQSQLRNTQHVCRTFMLGAGRSPLFYFISFHPGAVPDGACTSVNVNQQSSFTCARGGRVCDYSRLQHYCTQGVLRAPRLPCVPQEGPRAQFHTPNPVSCTGPVQSCLSVARVKTHETIEKQERKIAQWVCNLSPGRTGARQTAS